MNKKVLATAVAATLAAPTVMAQSDPELTVYARINNGLDIIDTKGTGGDTTADLRNVSSRFGFKGKSDLGNGLTVTGRYEFSTFTDREGDQNAANIAADGGAVKTRGGVNDTRLGWVALTGDLGTIKAGQQWSAIFNHVGTYMSPTFTVGYYLGTSVSSSPLRASNTISWAHSAGPVSWQLDTRWSTDTEPPQDVEVLGRDHGDDADGWGLGVSWAVTDNFTLGFAWDQDRFNVGDDVERIGLGASWTFAENHRITVASLNVDEGAAGRDDATGSIYYQGIFGDNRLLIGYLQSEESGGGFAFETEPDQFVFAFYHKMGGGFQIYFEGTDVDGDNGSLGEGLSEYLFGARYDF